MNNNYNNDGNRNYRQNQNTNNARMQNRRTSSQNASARDRAIAAEARRIEKIRRAKARKQAFDRFIAVSVFALIGVLISLIVIFGYIFVDFRNSDSVPDEAVIITLSDGNKVQFSENDYSFKDGEYYVSLTKLSSLCGLTLHGDVKNMTLSFSKDHYASFNIGYPVVEVAGTNCIMSSPCYFEKEQLFIPASFFSNHCNGVTITHNEKGKDKGFNIAFEKNFSLAAQRSSYTEPVIAETIGPNPNQARTPDFKADLSAYEMYMNPENKDEYLTLINTKNMLSSDYVPSDLVAIADTRKDGRSIQKMRLYAAKSLEALFIEMRANGFSDVSVTSGYRSYSYQQTLLDREIASLTPAYGDKAREKALTQVALPGSSEHQSGLCIDMHNLSAAHEKFASEDAYKWLYSNCANFGFILRFPKDKTDITGIIFEPWHYRFVGRYHAQKIMDNGLCLEEYMAQLDSYQ